MVTTVRTTALSSPRVRQSPLGAKYMDLQERRQSDCRYDTYRFPAAAAIPNRIEFFTIPENTAGSGFTNPKAFCQTNMVFPNKLERPGTVHEIRFSLFQLGTDGLLPAAAAIAAALLEDASVTLYVLRDPKIEVAMSQLGGYGITGSPDMTGGSGTPVAQAVVSLDPSVRPVKLSQPIPIPAQRYFRVLVEPNPNSSALVSALPPDTELQLRCYLNGKFEDTVA